VRPAVPNFSERRLYAFGPASNWPGRRIERTLFTLDWLENQQLRRQATAELNKGDTRNALARAVLRPSV
jgi:hypothetical protein